MPLRYTATFGNKALLIGIVMYLSTGFSRYVHFWPDLLGLRFAIS